MAGQREKSTSPAAVVWAPSVSISMLDKCTREPSSVNPAVKFAHIGRWFWILIVPPLNAALP